MVCSAYKMETQVLEGGKVEITVPIRPGVVVKVVVIAPDSATVAPNEDYEIPDEPSAAFCSRMSESALGELWNRPEEDEAWADL